MQRKAVRWSEMSGQRQPKGKELKVVYARVGADVYAELCEMAKAENLGSFGLLIERLLETVKQLVPRDT